VDRVIGDAERGEDVLVEVVVADQALVHLLEELARPGTLDDSVVIGARERDRLADAELGEVLRRGALEGRRVLQRAGADDASLTAHESRDRVLGSDAARVRERDRDALEVGRGELVGPRAGDDILIGVEELEEGHGVGALDAGHEERTGAVGLGQVDRDAERDVRRSDDRRLAVRLVVVHVLARELLERLHDRPADEVRERHLAAAGASQVVVDDDPVVDHELGGDRPHARGRRDGEARLHVGGEGLAHPLERDDGRLGLDGGLRALRHDHRAGRGCLRRNRLGFRGNRRRAGDRRGAGRGSRGFCCGCGGGSGALGHLFGDLSLAALLLLGSFGVLGGGHRVLGRSFGNLLSRFGIGRLAVAHDRDRLGRSRVVDRTVALEDRPPALVDRVLVEAVPLVHLVDEPFVGAELARGSVFGCDSGHWVGHSRPPTLNFF
jgi:hypothetical protein